MTRPGFHRRGALRRASACSAACALLIATPFSVSGAQASAQQRDSTIAKPLDTVVVTAERIEKPITASAAGVSVIDGRSMRSFPARSVADVLRFAPGLSFVDFGGSGQD